MARLSKLMMNRLIIALLLCFIIAISISIILVITLPASATEQKENRIKGKISEEFKDIDIVKLDGAIDSPTGKLEYYYPKDKSGNELGRVTVDEATEEIVAIVHSQSETFYGDPKFSNNELRDMAIKYLANWGYALDDYSLQNEELAPFLNDKGDKHSYVYQASWVKKIGDTSINFDGFMVVIDSYTGNIISASFPRVSTDKTLVANEASNAISKEEAIGIAEKECPTPEEWAQNKVKDAEDVYITVDKSAEKVLELDNLIWRVYICYEIYPKDKEANSDKRIDSQGYTFDVDARSGEIVAADMTR